MVDKMRFHHPLCKRPRLPDSDEAADVLYVAEL